MKVWLCGFCNEKHGVEVDCSNIISFKRKMDAALSAIQADYKKQIEDCRGEIRWLTDLVDIIGKKVGVTSERIKEIKESPINYSSIYFNPLEPLRITTEMISGALVGKETCKHSSQKHLEKCLRERNEKIKELEDKIEHREAVIKNRDEMIEGRNTKIDELENKLEFTAGVLEGNNEQIASLNDKNMRQGHSIKEMYQRIEKLEQQLAERNAECQQALNKANMQEKIANKWQLEYNASSERIERRNNELHAYAAANKSLQSVIKAREEELATLKQRSFGNPFLGNNCT